MKKEKEISLLRGPTICRLQIPKSLRYFHALQRIFKFISFRQIFKSKILSVTTHTTQ